MSGANNDGLVEEHGNNSLSNSINLSSCQANIELEMENPNKNFDGIDYFAYQDTIAQLYQEYYLVVDGGQTESLLTNVITATLLDSGLIHEELMSHSPNLSDTVMLSAIQQEEAIPPHLLTEILSANPSAAKSRQIQDRLNQRLLPLLPHQRDSIDQGLYHFSEREVLESWIGHYRTKARFIKHRYFSELLHTHQDPFEGILNFSPAFMELVDYYLLTDLYLAVGRTQSARTFLESIPEEFELSESESSRHNELTICYDILIRQSKDRSDSLSTDEYSQLFDIHRFGDPMSKGLARSILRGKDEFLYHEPLTFPRLDDLLSEKRLHFTPPENDLEVFPNPASTSLTIQLEDSAPGVKQVLVFNSAGILVAQQLMLDEKTTILDVRALKAGQYAIVVLLESGIMFTERIHVLE